MLFFGTNQTWNLGQQQDIQIQLSDRIILSPFVARRLWTLLGNVLKEYGQRFGDWTWVRAMLKPVLTPGERQPGEGYPCAA